MSKFNMDDFEDVNKSATLWEPKQSGSQKEGNLQARTAGDKSYMVGYYMGSEENAGKDGNSTIHYFKMEEVGDKGMLIGDPDGTDNLISIWGTGVLNDRIKEGVSEGDFTMIKWLGKKQSKKAGGRPYHSWKVAVNKKVAPMSVAGPEEDFSDNSAPVQEVVHKNEAVLDSFDDDDDLL